MTCQWLQQEEAGLQLPRPRRVETPQFTRGSPWGVLPTEASSAPPSLSPSLPLSKLCGELQAGAGDTPMNKPQSLLPIPGHTKTGVSKSTGENFVYYFCIQTFLSRVFI